MTTTEETEQIEATNAEKWLSVAAIVFFILFVLSRKLDWANFHVVVSTAGTPIIPHATGISGGAAWHAIGTPLILCAAALVPINLYFLFSDNALDPLGPAIANSVVGGLLVVASIYFIANTDGILGGNSGRSVTLSYDPATAAYGALVIAALLLCCGLAQLRSRLNA